MAYQEPPTRPSGYPTAQSGYPAAEDYPRAAAPPPPTRRQPDLDIPPAPLGLVALWDLWRKTTGTFSLDLSRRKLKGGQPGDSLWRVAAQPTGGGVVPGQRRGRGRPPARPQPPPQQRYGVPQGAYGAGPGGAYGAPPPAYGAPAGGGGYQGGGSHAVPYQAGLIELPNFAFMDTGARLKVMRHVQFGPKVEVERSTGLKRDVPTFDLGLGFAFDIDTAALQPQARLKISDILSIKALPYPAIKIQKRLRVPDSTWGVRLSYECPLENITTFYRPPARLMLSIDNMHTNGVQLTQAGLEFNYAALFGEQKGVQLRAAGLVSLPRELPIVEGQEPLVGVQIRRLGVKTEW